MSRYDPRHTKFDSNPRHDAILQALGGGRIVPVADLAAELGVVERTVRRDIEALRDLGHRLTLGSGLIMMRGPQI